MADPTKQEYAAAKKRGDARTRGPRAESAHFDAGRNRVIVRLTTGVEIGLVPKDVEGLQNASAADLKVIEIEALGLGIHFPRLDADLYVPGLLEGVLGSEAWMTAQRGAAGGSAGRNAKAAASRGNGKGGRKPAAA